MKRTTRTWLLGSIGQEFYSEPSGVVSCDFFLREDPSLPPAWIYRIGDLYFADMPNIVMPPFSDDPDNPLYPRTVERNTFEALIKRADLIGRGVLYYTLKKNDYIIELYVGESAGGRLNLLQVSFDESRPEIGEKFTLPAWALGACEISSFFEGERRSLIR